VLSGARLAYEKSRSFLNGSVHRVGFEAWKVAKTEALT
jgi:hypothetical protein